MSPSQRIDNFLFFPIVNYTDGDHETVREMLTDPGTLLGLSDGGAHCGAIVDASVPCRRLLARHPLVNVNGDASECAAVFNNPVASR